MQYLSDWRRCGNTVLATSEITGCDEVICNVPRGPNDQATVSAIVALPNLLKALRDIAGLAQCTDAEEASELRAALTDILEKAMPVIALAEKGA